MYNVIFSYGGPISLGQCVVTAQDDTTMVNFWLSTEFGYNAFTSLDISVGEKLYIDKDGYSIYFARISSIASNRIDLSSNPGQAVYNEVLKKGYIKPYVRRVPYLYSYPIEKYCGASLVSKGESYSVFAEANPIKSDATNTETNSVIALYFEKGNNIDEVRVNVRNGSEASVIKDINKFFRAKEDINFMSQSRKINKDIIGISSIIGSNKSKLY